MSRMTTYKGFGNGQIVDISNYNGKKEEAQDRTKRGKFLYIGFFDLNKYYLPNGKPNLSHPDLLNISIRSKQNKDNADKKIARDYKRKGWSYLPFPFQVDIKTGKPKNGRTRIRAALLNGERFIPCAYFDYEDDLEVSSYVQELTEGLIGNDGLVERVTTFEDLVEAGIAVVKKGDIEETRPAVLNLIANEFEAERFVDESEFTDIADMILDAVRDGQDTMWLPDRNAVIDYLKNSPDLPKDAIFAPLDQNIPAGRKRVFVYAAPSDTNKGRLWGMIAHEIPKGSYVVLYTTRKFPSKMKDDYVDFMDYQNWRYEECFKIVNLSNDQFQVKVPKTRPWELIGVLPQKMRDHDHVTAQSYNQLIKLEDLK